MRDHASSGKVRKLEGKVRRKQKSCVYQKERGENTCLRERTGDHDYVEKMGRRI